MKIALWQEITDIDKMTETVSIYFACIEICKQELLSMGMLINIKINLDFLNNS